MDVGALLKILDVPPGTVCGEHDRSALGLHLHHLHVRQQPQCPADGLRRDIVFRGHNGAAVNAAALRQLSLGNAGGQIQGDLQVLGENDGLFHQTSTFPTYGCMGLLYTDNLIM